MLEFLTDEDRMAYQIAENTPKYRHSVDVEGNRCPSLGAARVVTEIKSTELCSCSVIRHIRLMG